MERKKVAILLPWLKMGGTNKIALHFMRELSEYCDVTLILSQNTGELLSQLPDNIHLIIDQMKDFKSIVKEDVKKFRIISLIKDVIYYAKIRLGKDSVDNYKYIVDRHGYICDTEFDCAISYHGQSPERLLNLIYRTHSKKKVAWIHGEMSFSEDKINRLKKYYDKLDHFFFVSNPTKESFVKVIPVIDDKTTVYYNLINKQEILDKSSLDYEPEFSEEYINLLTVGRVSSEKGQDMIPSITRTLINLGHKVRWYIVGDGDMSAYVRKQIEELNVSDSVFMLGTKTNPYPYMKHCDIYIQPSYTEGYSTTICEAGMLGKAIVGTKPSGGIRDQITDGVDGLIVDATVERLSEGILQLIEDKGKRIQFEKEIVKKNFEGKGEIEKFLSYLN
ncbi:MAG: glycosyltransferase [Erysipelotrichaceae bacterium]|nr:glycosyltransferase [Erysipelotrichaceae bacterium]